MFTIVCISIRILDITIQISKSKDSDATCIHITRSDRYTDQNIKNQRGTL